MTIRLLVSKLVPPSRQHAALSVLALSAALLTGCGSNSTTTTTPPPPPPPPPPTAFTGVVKAAQQTIAGAAVTLYVAGTAGNGSAATPLFSAPLATDANGVFTVPATYTCPSGSSVIYAIARGGKAGTSSEANPEIALATVLGACSSLSAGNSITLNEATTVATAYAMAHFFSGQNIGGTATNSSGLLLAAATAANLVDISTGAIPGANFPSTGTPPTAKINTIANLLNACIVSTAPSTACNVPFGPGISPPVDTLTGALFLAQEPGGNVAGIYNMSQASAAYSPALTKAPADWTLAVNFGGGGLNAPSAVSIDSTGKIWVSNYYSVASFFTNTGVPVFANGITGNGLDNSYAGAVDANDNFWDLNEETSSSNNGLGSISVFNTAGSLTATYTSGGINFPLGIAFDPCGVAWVVDYGDSSISRLDSTGKPLSGATGYHSSSIDFPVAVATDANCNAYVANQSSNTLTRVSADGSDFTDFVVGNGPSGLTVDAGGNIWSANFYGDSIGLVSSSGTVLSGKGYTGGGIHHPQGIAADGSGNIWVANYLNTALSEIAGAAAPTPGVILSPAAGWAPDSNLTKAFGLAIDASGNIWITNFATNLLTEFVGLATPVQTPLVGPVRIP
jgi:hypothetical protein